MKILTKAIVAAGMLSLTPIASAELVQDCIIEGKIKKRSSLVQIDLKKAEPGSPNSKCNLRKAKHFKQPLESDIAQAPNGSKVTFRYTVDDKNKSEWKLVDLEK